MVSSECGGCANTRADRSAASCEVRGSVKQSQPTINPKRECNPLDFARFATRTHVHTYARPHVHVSARTPHGGVQVTRGEPNEIDLAAIHPRIERLPAVRDNDCRTVRLPYVLQVRDNEVMALPYVMGSTGVWASYEVASRNMGLGSFLDYVRFSTSTWARMGRTRGEANEVELAAA